MFGLVAYVVLVVSRSPFSKADSPPKVKRQAKLLPHATDREATLFSTLTLLCLPLPLRLPHWHQLFPCSTPGLVPTDDRRAEKLVSTGRASRPCAHWLSRAMSVRLESSPLVAPRDWNFVWVDQGAHLKRSLHIGPCYPLCLSPQLLSLSCLSISIPLCLFYLFIYFVIPFSLVPMLAGTIHHATEPRPPLPCLLPLTPKSGIRQTHPTAVQAFPLFINQNGVINHVPTA